VVRREREKKSKKCDFLSISQMENQINSDFRRDNIMSNKSIVFLKIGFVCKDVAKFKQNYMYVVLWRDCSLQLQGNLVSIQPKLVSAKFHL